MYIEVSAKNLAEALKIAMAYDEGSTVMVDEEGIFIDGYLARQNMSSYEKDKVEELGFQISEGKGIHINFENIKETKEIINKALTVLANHYNWRNFDANVDG